MSTLIVLSVLFSHCATDGPDLRRRRELLSFCWNPLPIPIETPTKERGGGQQNERLAGG